MENIILLLHSLYYSIFIDSTSYTDNFCIKIIFHIFIRSVILNLAHSHANNFISHNIICFYLFLIFNKFSISQETDDEVDGQKRKKKSPRRKKQVLSVSKDPKHTRAPDTAKNERMIINKKDNKLACKKRKYPPKRRKKPGKIVNENDKCDVDVVRENKEDTCKPGSSDGQVKRFLDESSECEESVVVSEMNDNLKVTSPEQQTAESESGK